VDAALLIRGRRLPRARAFAVVDIGAWWLAETGLPLPLGVNVVRRGLGAPLIARVPAVLAASIRWALAHRGAVIPEIAREERGDKVLSDQGLLDEYLKLYANDDTAAMADDTRRAIGALFARARAAGLIAGEVRVDFAP
jgi:1,4-dihydroxy-6-naphthoate synthase